MIYDITQELRDFTYITSVYKCIAAYNLKGHQIGRKVGDMLEILTMGGIYKNADLLSKLNTEGRLDGYTKVFLGLLNVNVLVWRKPLLKKVKNIYDV